MYSVMIITGLPGTDGQTDTQAARQTDHFINSKVNFTDL